MTTAPGQTKKGVAHSLIPREHGATAMLLTPFFAAAILLRRVYWPELAALVAIAAAMAIKDPLVIIARQRFVWKQEHPETRTTTRAAAILVALSLACAITLMLARDWYRWIPFFLGAGAFTVLAVSVNVRNKQRSEWFQVASAAALSTTCFIACLSAVGRIPAWCWLLWLLCTLQAVAGIFVVHSRLEARIAARKNTSEQSSSRRVAYFAQGVVMVAAACFVVLKQPWIAAALVLTAICYLAELQRQKQQASLQMPLTSVGLRALAQSTVYTLIVIVGLWQR